jgi:hypothetical protein
MFLFVSASHLGQANIRLAYPCSMSLRPNNYGIQHGVGAMAALEHILIVRFAAQLQFQASE